MLMMYWAGLFHVLSFEGWLMALFLAVISVLHSCLWFFWLLHHQMGVSQWKCTVVLFFPPTILSFLSSKDFLGFYVKMSLVFRFPFLSLLGICWCICWSKFITQPKCQHLQASSQPLPHFLRTAVIAMLIECHFQRKFPDLHLFHENEILFHSLSAFCWLLNPECTYLKAMSPRFFFFPDSYW